MNDPKSPPWEHIAMCLPEGFTLSRSGLYHQRSAKTGEERIAGPCWVSGESRSVDHADAGVVVSWWDRHQDIERQVAVPKRRFHETGNHLIQDLVDQGLDVIPSYERQLLRYLGSFHLPTAMVMTSSSRVGWSVLAAGKPAFVLPDQTIVESVDESVVILQGAEQLGAAITSSGSLENWQRNVAAPCRTHELLCFAISAAFAAPLLKLVNLDSGGFHFYGASSKGKTTLLQVASSVWGNGADPAVSPASYISRWNSTANAFEAVATTYNDLMLPLDELGTCDAKDVGKVVYDLFGGRGKSRLTKDSVLRKHRAWQLLGLSSGEISLRQKIYDHTGQAALAGQAIRLADVPIPLDGVLDPLFAGNSKDEINRIKAACAGSYGIAGPLFVQRLLDDCASCLELGGELTMPRLRREIADRLQEVESAMSEGLEVESLHERVLRRFSVVALGGMLAAEYGVFPIEKASVMNAVMQVRNYWLGDDQNLPDEIRFLNELRSFLLLNANRFRHANDEAEIVQNCAGYRAAESGGPGMLYLIEPSVMDDLGVTARCDRKMAERALNNRGLLFTNEAGRKTSKHSIAGMRRPRFFAVRDKILEQD